MTTDTSEKGLERLICAALTGADCDPTQGGIVRERPSWLSSTTNGPLAVDTSHLSC